MRFVFILWCLNTALLFSANLADQQKAGLLERAICSLSELIAGRECCRSARVDFRFEEFLDEIQKKLHGQETAAHMVAHAVSTHWNPESVPHKALVLTLHGPTGVGKTYITKILAEYTFAKGDKSQFYHFFSASLHFPHRAKLAEYTDQLRSWVSGNVSKCEKSLFVFDEIDKMPVGLLDSLKTFLDYRSNIDGVDYRRSIFVFLSNIGSDLVMRKLATWKRGGRDRIDFPSEMMDSELSDHAFRSDLSSLKDSQLLRHHLISRFIPFLPLERIHVERCIRDYLSEKGERYFSGSAEFVQSVLQEMPFVPDDVKFFSSMGCKRVPDKVDEAIEALSWRQKSRTNEL